MKLNLTEFEDFCGRWLAKASLYNSGSLSDCFDRFTTLYIVFNRVYTEIGNLLRDRRRRQARNSSGGSPIRIQVPKKPFAPLPDRLSATQYVVEYYGRQVLEREIRESPECQCAIDCVVELIETKRFYFHVNYDTGQPDFDKDLSLAQAAKAHVPEAILSLIYQARCNLFHGSKGFSEIQRDLIRSLSILLEFITTKVYNEFVLDLRREQSFV